MLFNLVWKQKHMKKPPNKQKQGNKKRICIFPIINLEKILNKQKHWIFSQWSPDRRECNENPWLAKYIAFTYVSLICHKYWMHTTKCGQMYIIILIITFNISVITPNKTVKKTLQCIIKQQCYIFNHVYQSYWNGENDRQVGGLVVAKRYSFSTHNSYSFQDAKNNFVLWISCTHKRDEHVTWILSFDNFEKKTSC